MSETNTEQLSLDELRRLEQGLLGGSKVMSQQVPKGLTRTQAHALFDKSRQEAVQAYEGALDELIAALGNLPGPYYTLNLPRRYAGLATLEVLASDQLADAVHARIDAAPLGGGIAYENEKEQQVARDNTQRSPGKWAIVLDIGRDAETGKRKQKWVSGYRTKGQAEDALVELLGKRKRGETVDPDMTPLADYLTAWIDGRADELAPLSVTQYRSVVRNHVSKTPLGGMPLGRIRKAHVRAHEAELQRKGLSISTRNVVRAVLSRALADAVEDDLISTDPSAGRRRSGERRSEPKRFTVWTSDELRTLLDTAAGDRFEALWRVAVASGARRGELLGLTWLGFSAEEGTLTISQQVVPTRGGPSIHSCKTKGSHRTIRLDADTVEALEAHREAQLVERELAADAYSDSDLIFCDELGGIINPQRLTEKFGALRKAAGIREGRLHDVRHTSATHLLTRGVPVHIVSARLGHSSPMVTLSVYAHVLPTGDEQAAEVMAEVLA